jgi:ferredoxin-NADP reductase
VKSFVAEVTESVRLYGDTHALWFRSPDHLASASPGQFVMTYAGETFDPLLGRAFSIYRKREGERGAEFGILFDVVGRGTDWLARRREGDMVRMVGPLGRGFEPRERVQKMLLVGGGIGVAPLVWFADELIAQGREVTMVLGGRDRTRHRPVRAAAVVVRPGLRLWPAADVRGALRSCARQRHEQARAGPPGGSHGLRPGHLLLMRRLPSKRRR